MIFERYADLLCRTAKVPRGDYTAEQLTYFIRQWPMPNAAMAGLGLTLNEVPIVFLDEPFSVLGKRLLDLWNGGNAMHPIGLMPVGLDWQEDTQAKTLMGYLGGHGLGVQMMVEDEITCRGERVLPCDFRFTFMRGFSYT